MYCDSKSVLGFFQKLEEHNIEYAVVRDVEYCLPNKIDGNKDVDIIVHPKKKKVFQECMKEQGFRKERHPWDFGNNFIFLYAMDKFEFYVRGDLRIDVCYQLSCRSTEQGEWVPIDQLIQHSVWNNRKKNAEYGYYELSAQDEFVHLITRAIFDKKMFNEDYRKRLEFLYQIIDMEDVKEKLSLVVFKYTEQLLEQIEKKAYDTIYENYIKFTQY